MTRSTPPRRTSRARGQRSTRTTPSGAGGPRFQKARSSRGAPAAATVYTDKYKEGAQLPIVAPKDATAGLKNPTLQQAADAAPYLPAANRKAINTVLLNAVTNPADP